MGIKKDKTALIGRSFGDLEVLGYQGVENKTRHWWWCRCNCGEELAVREDSLKSGHSKTCGCRGFPKGIDSKSVEYQTWSAMIQRCTNPKVDMYPHYGGRGIEVCERWRESFKNFFEDMGLRPGPEYSIERKDRNGNYEPDNCIWADRFAQANNKSNNVLIEFEGRTQTVQQWARELDIRPQTIRERLDAGLPPDQVLSKFRLDEKPIEFNGKIQSVSQWAEELGITVHAIRQRRLKGLPVEDILRPESLAGWRLEYKGQKYTPEELAVLTGIKVGTLRQRIRLGLTPEEAIELPNDPWAVRRYLQNKSKG